MAKDKPKRRAETPGIIEIGGDRFYTAAGLAKALGMNEQVIRRYHNRGLIQGNRLGGKTIVFTEQAVKNFLSGATAKG